MSRGVSVGQLECEETNLPGVIRVVQRHAEQLLGKCVLRPLGDAIELRGRSPVADGSSALAERDLLVTVARPDGAVSYMVFVAPEPDYQTLKPLFSSMIQSFRVR